MWPSFFVFFLGSAQLFVSVESPPPVSHLPAISNVTNREQFYISVPKHSKTTGMLQAPCLSSQTHLMKVLQREWHSLLKALRLFLWLLGVPWLWICSCFPLTGLSGACGTLTRSFQGLGSAWCSGFLLCRGCWVGVLLLVPFRYLNCTYFPSSLSPHIIPVPPVVHQHKVKRTLAFDLW